MQRSQIKALIDSKTSYDPSTLMISRAGWISAQLDPDKRPGCDNVRRLVCHLSQINKL